MHKARHIIKLSLVILLFIFFACKKEEINITYANVITTEVVHVTNNTAFASGEVNYDGGSSIFERGFVWSNTDIPNVSVNTGKIAVGNDVGMFQSTITNLIPETYYSIRAYAINDAGASYGSILGFTTLSTKQFCPGSAKIYDINGNEYEAIIIGSQCWLTENLKATRHADDTDISEITNSSLWSATTESAYSYYNNQFDVYGIAYGPLYNFNVIHSSNICPEGWKVPNLTDIETLKSYLGINSGGKLKSVRSVPGDSHPRWFVPNYGATNEYGFNAEPGGKRLNNGIYDLNGFASFWWLVDEKDSDNAYSVFLSSTSDEIQVINSNKKQGLSIRCMKNL